MNGIRARQFGHADNLGDAEIGPHRRQAFADAIGLIRLEAVQGKLVFLGIDGDGFFAHFIGGTHDADGNLAPVGDQDFAEFGHCRISGAKGRAGTRALYSRCNAAQGQEPTICKVLRNILARFAIAKRAFAGL